MATSLPQRYDPVDIFNADETALFWKATAGKTLTFKNDPCVGTKQNKCRVTILPCANMTGTEKRRLLVIGKYENPRALKGRKHKTEVHLYIEYQSVDNITCFHRLVKEVEP